MGLCHGNSRRVFPADPFDQHTKIHLSNHTIHTPYVSAGFGSVGMHLAEHIQQERILYVVLHHKELRLMQVL